MFKAEGLFAAIVYRYRYGVRRVDACGVRHAHDIGARIAVRVCEIGRVKGLKKGLPQQIFIEPDRVVPDEDGRRPFQQLAANLYDSLIMGRQGRIG